MKVPKWIRDLNKPERKSVRDEKRMHFIWQIKSGLIKQLHSQGISMQHIDDAFMQWESGKDSRTLIEAGLFEVFRKVQRNLRETGTTRAGV